MLGLGKKIAAAFTWRRWLVRWAASAQDNPPCDADRTSSFG
jgi:hypothetical protein